MTTEYIPAKVIVLTNRPLINYPNESLLYAAFATKKVIEQGGLDMEQAMHIIMKELSLRN